MPTYDYQCDACGHEFELFQSMTAPVKRKCPACGKNKLQRLIGTGAGVIFKGSGFYETDYRSDSYKKAAESDSKPAADSTANKEAGTEKPATEKPSKSDAATESTSAAPSTAPPKNASKSAASKKTKKSA